MLAAREAPATGRAAVPTHGSRRPRHDRTQPQLFALPGRRRFLKADRRGIVARVAERGDLRRAPGLRKAPHRSALAHASRRLLADAEGGGAFGRARAAPVQRARATGLIDRAPPVAAVDATGLETRHAGAHSGMRRADGHGRRQRARPKSTAVVRAHPHRTVGAVPGVGPNQGSPDASLAMRQAADLLAIGTALAEAGRGAEHNHRLRREEPGVRRTGIRRNTGRRWPRTPCRQAMRRRFERELYNQRRHAESGFSQHKRRLGSALAARRNEAQRRDLVLRVITHYLMLLTEAA